MAAKNKKAATVAAAIAMALISLLVPPGALADGFQEPQPPNYLIKIVPGIPLIFNLEEKLPAETDSVRFDIDGEPFTTDDFEPFGDYIPTESIERRGVGLETVHSFTIVALSFLEPPVTVAEYHLLVHRLPVIPRFQPLPLVRENQRKLVGFQLRGVSAGSKVRMWGRGFRHLRGRRQLSLRLIRIGERSRTYAVRGGLTWRRGASPQVVVSVHPGYRIKYGAWVRGRLYRGVLRTTRGGDTSIRRTGSPDSCTAEIARRRRPPPQRSCDHL